MLRAQLKEALTEAMKAKDARRIATIRLILAAVKDRDIASRSDGTRDGVSNDEILVILAKMIRQRQESIAAYETGGREDLAAQEREEIAIIQSFQPPQLGEAEMARACADAVAEAGANSLKDMGRTMSLLKERYAGLMDFAKASAMVKTLLSQRE